MTDINLNARRNNLVSFMTKVMIVMMIWICLVVSGLFFYITEENNKKITADQRVELMTEQLNELQLEALGLFIYSTDILPHDESSVRSLSDKERVLQARVGEELKEMVRIYREIDSFPEISLDIDSLLNVRTIKQKSAIVDAFQTNIAKARNVLHEFKWIKRQEYLASFELFQQLILASALITLVGVALTFLMIRRRLSHGLESTLSLVKKYQHKHYNYSPDWAHNDEFREIFFQLQQLKESSLEHADRINRDKCILEDHFQNIQEPCVGLDADRRLVLSNKLFELIWSEYQVELESVLCQQDELSLDLEETYFVDIEGNESIPRLFHFNGLAYSLTQERILEEAKLVGYLLKFNPVSDELEYEAVSKIVSLMASDVWTAPVRVKREASRVASLAVQLEKIRLSVLNLINLFDGMTLKGETQSIHSLKDLSELIIALSEALNEANTIIESHEVVEDGEIEVEENNASPLPELDFEPIRAVISGLRQNVEESIFSGSQVNVQNNELINELETSLLLGYENLSQSLTIVYKGMETSVSALQDGFDCMSEVKVALLNAISKKEEHTDIDLQGIIVDLSHDIDTVSQLLQSSLARDKETLMAVESDMQDCQERSSQAKEKVKEFSAKNKESDFASQSESMMKDVFMLNDVLDDLIKKSKP